MTENAPAGWYAQPDGSQRYWDGSEWTPHIVPAGTPQPEAAPGDGNPDVPVSDSTATDDRPLWKKKRLIIPVAAVAALIGISALGTAMGGGGATDDVAASPSPSATVEEVVAEPTESPAPTTLTMPDVVGTNLQDAQDSLQALGSYFLDQEDASGEDRTQIVDSNWRVCTQEPVAGTEIPIEATVILASVKEDEPCPGDEPEDTTRADEQEEQDEPAERDEPDEPADEGPTETAGQRNARQSAESYLAFSAFSRSGLMDQLDYEGYDAADAEYAVDAVGADWNEQAVKSAESYLDFSAFSHSGLIDQLEYEGFTTAQATHGADSVDADWNEQAVKSAESYLDFSSFSRSGLIDQLVYEGFSREQATYAVDEVGL
ncbi:Ltp family lipoprotein [Demequina sp. SO4-18]|uniref:Ltp family lipoprotein n=1 Tax=Demequina sp. SO4-18 TaxID=3401026 RepID=UPI003B58E654